MKTVTDTWRTCRMPCRGSSRANPPRCFSGRRSGARQSTSSLCRRPAQFTWTLFRSYAASSFCWQMCWCSANRTARSMRFDSFWSVEFLLCISVPSLPARHARHCKAEIEGGSSWSRTHASHSTLHHPVPSWYEWRFQIDMCTLGWNRSLVLPNIGVAVDQSKKARTKSKAQSILHHWWTSVIWRMTNWRQSTKNAKVGLCSEVILWKTILALTQYSLNKGHQHLNWQPPKSWISSPDCQVAMDKQQTQYQLIYTQVKWKMLTIYWKFPNRSVQTFGFVYHDTNGLNHGRTLKTLWFHLNETCMATRLAAFCGKDSSKKFYGDWDGRKVPNWECLFVLRKQWLFLSVHVDDFKMDGRKQNLRPKCKKWMKLADLGEPTSFLDHLYMGCTQREAERKHIWTGTERCLKHEFLLEQLKIVNVGRNLTQTVAWSSGLEGHANNALKDVVSWRMKEFRSFRHREIDRAKCERCERKRSIQ